jgi:ribosomal protein L12E/L44/L45/RPP1/RPP2
LLTFELPAIKQTATILALNDIKKDETKDNVASAVIDFLLAPTGKTFEEVQKDEPEEEEEEEEAEEEEEEEVKPKGKKGRGSNSAGRPKRVTATKVWTNGKFEDVLR